MRKKNKIKSTSCDLDNVYTLAYPKVLTKFWKFLQYSTRLHNYITINIIDVISM